MGKVLQQVTAPCPPPVLRCRLTLAAIEGLRDELVDAGARCRRSKPHVVLSSVWHGCCFSCCSRHRSWADLQRLFAPESEGATAGARSFLARCVHPPSHCPLHKRPPPQPHLEKSPNSTPLYACVRYMHAISRTCWLNHDLTLMSYCSSTWQRRSEGRAHVASTGTGCSTLETVALWHPRRSADCVHACSYRQSLAQNMTDDELDVLKSFRVPGRILFVRSAKDHRKQPYASYLLPTPSPLRGRDVVAHCSASACHIAHILCSRVRTCTATHSHSGPACSSWPGTLSARMAAAGSMKPRLRLGAASGLCSLCCLLRWRPM